jgi:hypothetical protein
MQNRNLAILATCGALLVGACSGLMPPAPGDSGAGGGSGGSSGKDAGPVTSVDGGLALGAACLVLGEQRCAYLQRCALIGASAKALRECQSAYAATTCRTSRWPARVDAGTLRYNPLGAETCAATYLTRGCDAFETEPSPCNYFLTPGSYLQGPCYGGYTECPEGVCRGTACPRSCQAPGVADEPCAEMSDCRTDAGFFCRTTATSPGVGKCAAYAKYAAACNVEQPCLPEFFCNPFGQCELRRKVGEVCTGATCVDAAWCYFTPQDGGFCADRELVDQPCTDTVQCRSGLLCEPLLGACAIAGPVADGGLCSVRQRCTGSIVCVGASESLLGTCLAPVEARAACSSSFDCAAHLSCASLDGGPRVCVPRLDDGSPCAAHRDCRVYSRCANSSCTPLAPPGSACVAGQCLFGSCQQLLDGGSLCADIGGPGATCAADAECGSNRCVAGRCLAACGP